jgi:hypothetical protein
MLEAQSSTTHNATAPDARAGAGVQKLSLLNATGNKGAAVLIQ